LAYEEASRLYRLALDNLELAPASTGDDVSRYELMMALGAAYKRSGAIDDAQAAFREAAAIAERSGDPIRYGEAVLGFARPGLRAGLPDYELMDQLEHAIELAGPTPTPLLARLLGRLAFELVFAD